MDTSIFAVLDFGIMSVLLPKLKLDNVKNNLLENFSYKSSFSLLPNRKYQCFTSASAIVYKHVKNNVEKNNIRKGIKNIFFIYLNILNILNILNFTNIKRIFLEETQKNIKIVNLVIF